MKPIDITSEGSDYVADIYREWIEAEGESLRRTKAFDKWCRHKFFFDREKYDCLTGSNKEIIKQSEAYLRDLRDSLGKHLHKGDKPEISDWFEGTGRSDMGSAQERVDDNRGEDKSGEVESGDAVSFEPGRSGSEGWLFQSGDVEGTTDGENNSSRLKDRRKIDKMRFGKGQDKGTGEVFTGLHPKFEDLV